VSETPRLEYAPMSAYMMDIDLLLNFVTRALAGALYDLPLQIDRVPSATTCRADI
jgi:hypothetical protein